MLLYPFSRAGRLTAWPLLLPLFLLLTLPMTGCPDGDDDDASQPTPGDDDDATGDDDDATGDDDDATGDDDDATGDDDDATGDDDDATGDDDDATGDDDDTGNPDADGDGVPADEDCDEEDPLTFPGADEVCDEKDNDCDGEVDDGVGDTWYIDADHDSYGDSSSSVISCFPPPSTSQRGGDCDDADPFTHPEADEPCDGKDNDCDGEIDEAGASTFYPDTDGDGYGSDADPYTGCAPPEGYVGRAGDCSPDDAAIHPGADEVCDEVDNDCDEAIDEEAVDAPTWYADADGDQYGNAASSTRVCDAPAGSVATDGDCDDADASVNPDADESCDDIDEDCDGGIDEEAIDAPTWYADADGDQYGNPASSTRVCDAPAGSVATAGDCDDGESGTHPGAAEDCDEVDQDCDGLVDDGAVDAPTWYADADEDAYGDPTASTTACDAPPGFLEDDSDCDDDDPEVNPDGIEQCDGIDNDCDEATDEESAVDAATWYRDADEDSYGSAASTTRACGQPAGYVGDNDDCDDGDPAVNPGATEVCDLQDNDCDGVVDPNDAWWDPAWPYRIPVTLTGASQPVAGPPVAMDVDFGAALADLGDDSSFLPGTVRVVVQDCALGQPELPSQFLDAWARLFDKADDADPVDDEKGAVVFLYDTDGDYRSLETLAAGATVDMAIYFASVDGGPFLPNAGYETGLTAGSSQISTGVAKASFDAAAGGMLSALTVGASPSVMSQTISCCGNSIYSGGWNIDPQDLPGTLTLIEDGPVFAAYEASGSRSSAVGAYRYVYTYWMFAGRPELWSKVYQVTTATTLLDHTGDYTSGIRPWESQQVNISGGATFTKDPALRYLDVSNGTWGVSWAYAKPPRFVTGADAYNPYIIVSGNEVGPAGTGTNKTVAAGTVVMDNIVQIVMPHAGGYNTVQSTMQGLVGGVGASSGDPQAH